MYDKYGDDVQFFMVYIREAHPTDGWQTQANVREGILIQQPKTYEQRVDVVHTMCTKLNIKLPALVDSIDDKANKAYSAIPDRMYLVGKDGRIAYKGEHGPQGFKPEELDLAIQLELALH
jgi:hypothetical protein